MLQAELHGEVPRDLGNDENLLTSNVFGLLKYVSFGPFWSELLRRTRNLGGESPMIQNDVLKTRNLNGSSLWIHFWPSHREFGRPDMLVVFGGDRSPRFCFAIEVKLDSLKSGEEDQLDRYQEALLDKRWIRATIGRGADCVPLGVIYLTPRDAWSEVEDSIRRAKDQSRARASIFLLQWQDVLEAAEQMAPAEDFPYSAILQDVARYLEHRGLKYFRGFTECTIDDILLPFARQTLPAGRAFRGFSECLFDRDSSGRKQSGGVQ